MTRYLLDTNIISNAVRPVPSPDLVTWLGMQPDSSLFISALTVGEVWRGILALPGGKRRRALEAWFGGPDGPPSLFAGRVLAYDEPAALAWARLMAEGAASGRPRNALDTIVAAVALVNDCVIVTDNERDFAGLGAINPMRPVQ